jgi:hypothetical protein
MDLSVMILVLFWLTLASGLIAIGARVAAGDGARRDYQEAALARLARLKSPEGIPFFLNGRALFDLARALDEIEEDGRRRQAHGAVRRGA